MAAPMRTPRAVWIEQGLAALAAGSAEAVRVEVLAKQLGVTKGGFYGHFRSRQDLLDEVLNAWEAEVIDRVIERVEERGGDARAKLRRLFAIAASLGQLLEVELAVREWARRDRAVAARIKRVDNRRMDYLRGLFSELGFTAADGEARSLLVLTLFVGNSFLAADHGERSRTDVAADALALLVP